MARTDLKRRLRHGAIGLLVLLLGAAALALLVYPPAYVWHTLSLGDSDVDDQFRFPKRELQAAPGASEMPANLQPQRVRDAFAAVMPGQALDPWLAANSTQGFVVLQRGRVLYEAYFNGQRRDDTATSFSVAKSVLGTLVDLAVADRRIGSLDDPVTKYLSELRQRDPRFEQITLRHLMNMNAGLHYTEYPFLTSDGAKTYYWPDLRQLALQHATIERPPGEAWLYNNYHPLLLGLVLERSTGMPVTRWFEQRLWQPAGMAAGRQLEPGQRIHRLREAGKRHQRAHARLRPLRPAVSRPGRGPGWPARAVGRSRTRGHVARRRDTVAAVPCRRVLQALLVGPAARGPGLRLQRARQPRPVRVRVAEERGGDRAQRP